MPDETIIDVFWKRVRENPDRPAILQKKAGSYHPVSWLDHGQIVEHVSAALIGLGVNASTKIGIMSTSRPKWTWADIGIMSCGGVTVPIYPTLNTAEVEYLLKHCEASGIFVENPRQLARVVAAEHLPKCLKFIVLMDGEPDQNKDGVTIIRWPELLNMGAEQLVKNKDLIKSRVEKLTGDTLATIVYTSGTTGIPKGVMLKHSNILFICQTLSVNVGFTQDDVLLSFLPLSHIFERIGGQFLSIYDGLLMAYAESMETVPQNIVETRPTIMNAVPRFYEKAYNRIIAEVRKFPTPQQYLVRWALALGRRALRKREAANGAGELVANVYRTELRVADRLVFSRIRKRFGGRLRFLVSGAAPLSIEVHEFFETIGMPILEGYGLTETTAPVACNKPTDYRRGTVGKPLPGISVKLAADGEIMVKGPSVFSGYFKNEEATKEAFIDGWFATGDIGEFDAEGYLRIKDRKKDLIITAGGKHVAPQYVENLFAGERLVSRIMVFGDRRKYITALITLNPDALESFARQQSLSHATASDLFCHPAVEQEIADIIARKNQRLAQFEQIKRFAILDTDFTVETGELTPTLKMKRKTITQKYKQALDKLYDSDDLKIESV